MKLQKYLLATAGIVSTIFGISITIPAFLENKYTAAIIASFLIVIGIIFLAMSFGE